SASPPGAGCGRRTSGKRGTRRPPQPRQEDLRDRLRKTNCSRSSERHSLVLHDSPDAARRTVPLVRAVPVRQPHRLHQQLPESDLLLSLYKRPHRGDERSRPTRRSEEHTSELQSRFDLVCRLLLEKKKKTKK